MNKTFSYYYLYPLPNIPTEGKELKIRLFPRGGNGRGGYVDFNKSD
jgi:hypothetical protein